MVSLVKGVVGSFSSWTGSAIRLSAGDSGPLLTPDPDTECIPTQRYNLLVEPVPSGLGTCPIARGDTWLDFTSLAQTLSVQQLVGGDTQELVGCTLMPSHGTRPLGTCEGQYWPGDCLCTQENVFLISALKQCDWLRVRKTLVGRKKFIF